MELGEVFRIRMGGEDNVLGLVQEWVKSIEKVEESGLFRGEEMDMMKE